MTKENWFEMAEKNRKDAVSMIQLGHRDWGLFVWHLALEKLLKGLILSSGKDVPLLHDLARLSILAGASLSDDQLDQLEEISTFNTEARYDNEKYEFYKKATPEYTKKWDQICEDLYQCLMKTHAK